MATRHVPRHARAPRVRWLTDTGHVITDRGGAGLLSIRSLAGEIAAYVRDHGLTDTSRRARFEAINLAALRPLVLIVPTRAVNVGAALFVLLSVAAPLRVGGLASMAATAVLFRSICGWGWR